MSAIDAVTGGAGSAAAGATTTKPAMKDEFMRLFIAQLQNQDPLAPQDSSAFVAQLAQLSQVEQATETNNRLQSIADEQAAASRASLSALVGHQVEASAQSIEIVKGPATASMKVTLAGEASEAKLELVDAGGNVARSVDLGAHAAGELTVPASALAGVSPGAYTIRITAKNASGGPVSGTTSISGVIDAMQLDSGGKFRLGSIAVTPASILSVGASVTSQQESH